MLWDRYLNGNVIIRYGLLVYLDKIPAALNLKERERERENKNTDELLTVLRNKTAGILPIFLYILLNITKQNTTGNHVISLSISENKFEEIGFLIGQESNMRKGVSL